MRRLVALAALASSMALPLSAAAQPFPPSPASAGTTALQPGPSNPSASARATARSLAREGSDAQKKGNYALAADRFQRAEDLVDAPTLLLGLARAQVGLGKFVEADETYRRILRAPPPTGAPAPFAKAVEEASKEAPAVAARRAWVTVVVQGPSSPQVLIDDVAVPGAAIGIKLACNPGAHTVKATATGFAAAERPFAIAEGTSQTIPIPMEREAPPPPPAPVAQEEPKPEATPLPSSPPPEESSPGSGQRTAGIAVLGVGIAGLVVGGVTGAIALGKHGSLSDSCPDGHCTADQTGAVSTYRTFANVSTVAVIAGGVVAATGLTLFLTAPSRSSQVGVYAGPMGAGFTGKF
jgi:hypothetical protein